MYARLRTLRTKNYRSVERWLIDVSKQYFRLKALVQESAAADGQPIYDADEPTPIDLLIDSGPDRERYQAGIELGKLFAGLGPGPRDLETRQPWDNADFVRGFKAGVQRGINSRKRARIDGDRRDED